MLFLSIWVFAFNSFKGYKNNQTLSIQNANFYFYLHLLSNKRLTVRDLMRFSFPLLLLIYHIFSKALRSNLFFNS